MLKYNVKYYVKILHATVEVEGSRTRFITTSHSSIVDTTVVTPQRGPSVYSHLHVHQLTV